MELCFIIKLNSSLPSRSISSEPVSLASLSVLQAGYLAAITGTSRFHTHLVRLVTAEGLFSNLANCSWLRIVRASAGTMNCSYLSINSKFNMENRKHTFRIKAKSIYSETSFPQETKAIFNPSFFIRTFSTHNSSNINRSLHGWPSLCLVLKSLILL